MQTHVDILIFGGGIAGLWLLNRLRTLGYDAHLLETHTLGGVQTIHSQGIIHGGMKYALQGTATQESRAIADMPTRWKNCLVGSGEINLSAARILSTQQYLWSTNKLAAKVANFFASTALTSKIKNLKSADYPAIFQTPEFKGGVFALDEVVLDIPSVIKALSQHLKPFIYKIENLSAQHFNLQENGALQSITMSNATDALEIKAQQYIFTAGAGNELFLQHLRQHDIAMQRRPLHMVLIKAPKNYSLYAHCLGLSAKPRLTISTHYNTKGECFWYLGGQLAEEGVERTSDAQIKMARIELKNLFPWLDFLDAPCTTFYIERAEPYQRSGQKPETIAMHVFHNMIVAWPTKLAFAPLLADHIIAHLANLSLNKNRVRHEINWPTPPYATPLWEHSFC